MINSCISVLYLECWYVFVLVFDYCNKVVSRERISNVLEYVGCIALLDSVLICGRGTYFYGILTTV